MKIKIIRRVPTNPSPTVGQEYEVIRVHEREKRFVEMSILWNVKGRK